MAAKSNVDRLSSLPNDILIDIVSRLPIRLAIVSEILSSRWRGLWTNVTSVDITKRYCVTYSEFSAAISDIVSQIKSPNIHNLTLQFTGDVESRPQDYSWLREICDRNLCRLNLTWPSDWLKAKLPNFIFQTSSLVSIELHTEHTVKLPDNGDSNPINLPNLRYLRLSFSKCELLHKLIKACPSLEELSIKCKYSFPFPSFNCSNPNLRRLFVDLKYSLKVDVVINAPTLHYLAIDCPLLLTLKFEEKSIGLRELKIVGNNNLALGKSVFEINGDYWSICNVRFLNLNVNALNNISTRFCYVTRATLLMYLSHDIKSVLRLMELCPVLEILCLKCGMYERTEENTVQTSNDLMSPFFRGPSTIIVETYTVGLCRNTGKPQKSFLEMIEYLLINGQNLKYFQFKLDDDDDERYGCYRSHMSIEVRRERRRHELNFCKLLYYSATVSVECEVEFKGLFFNMSRKVGPKAWSRDSEEVIPLSDKSWNGFVLDEE